MEKKYVEYNGQRVVEGWPERIAAAQLERTYEIKGVENARVAYGEEADDWGADTRETLILPRCRSEAFHERV